MRQWKKTNVLGITALHLFALASVPYLFQIKFLTVLWTTVIVFLAGFGVTAGAHRLWSHRSYKAVGPFRVFLALCFSIAAQKTIPRWVLDHRTHHKFSDTDADPHNAKEGFWFSHVGWMMMTKHPEVIKNGSKIPMDDVLSDPVVEWHTKYFWILNLSLCVFIPIFVPKLFWDENLKTAAAAQIIRHVFLLNATWSVNSVAHIFGDRPFDPKILPVQNKIVAMFSLGEGWHNYHHVFPYDYKAAELGSDFNFTKKLLDFSIRRGWVYDAKEPSVETINNRLNSLVGCAQSR